MPTEAICFDLGGVLAQISTRWFDILTRLALAVPNNISPDSDLSDMPHFDSYQAGELTTAEYYVELSRYLGTSIDDAKRVHENILVAPFPGVLEVVEELNAKGILTGCFSNTNPPHWIELALNGRFPAVVATKIKLASFEVNAYKPDARAYELFTFVAGVPATSTLLFDDSLKNCHAAGALGWETQHIDPLADPAKQMRIKLRELGVL